VNDYDVNQFESASPARSATHACQVCGKRYLANVLFDLKGNVPGGCKVTCLECCGALTMREAAAKAAATFHKGSTENYHGDRRERGQEIAATIRSLPLPGEQTVAPPGGLPGEQTDFQRLVMDAMGEPTGGPPHCPFCGAFLIDGACGIDGCPGKVPDPNPWTEHTVNVVAERVEVTPKGIILHRRVSTPLESGQDVCIDEVAMSEPAPDGDSILDLGLIRDGSIIRLAATPGKAGASVPVVWAEVPVEADCDAPAARCPTCGWPLKATIEEGCTAGNCSERPLRVARDGNVFLKVRSVIANVPPPPCAGLPSNTDLANAALEASGLMGKPPPGYETAPDCDAAIVVDR
jgi:hypothetical protein